MHKPDDDAGPPNPELVRILQEELPPIEPPAQVREDLLQRILNRTVRSWRQWLNRSNDRLDD
jgi:hypothetical protein